MFTFSCLCAQALKGACQLGVAVVTLAAVGLIVPQHYDMRPDIKTNFALAIEVQAGRLCCRLLHLSFRVSKSMSNQGPVAVEHYHNHHDQCSCGWPSCKSRCALICLEANPASLVTLAFAAIPICVSKIKRHVFCVLAYWFSHELPTSSFA